MILGHFDSLNLTMPGLNPVFDIPSRPIEGYPPVGPPPQLPATDHETNLFRNNEAVLHGNTPHRIETI